MKCITLQSVFSLLTAIFLCMWSLAPQAMAGSSQTTLSEKPAVQDTAGPEAVFPQMAYDFTSVMEGVDIKHDFIIENHGDAPLVIQNVRPD